jgi:hypothetical protein
MEQSNLLFKRNRSITQLLMLATVLFTGCSERSAINDNEMSSVIENQKVRTDITFTGSNNSSLSLKAVFELRQAKAATAKYQSIENAKADGYHDISVDVENMGHHYMKISLVDAEFDLKHPEILVYNKDKNGKQRLVAVEYAIPLSEPRPQGFTGDADVWDGNTVFGLWLLHAWVWEHNPAGVFNSTNPDVHLH